MIKDIRKAALGYSRWKEEQTHCRKPWRYPEDITLPRILISDCLDTIESSSESKNNETTTQKKESKTLSLPSTPTTHYKPISNVFPSTNLVNGGNYANGNSLPTSTTGSPLKKVKKKFKFKFDKKSTE